MNNNTSLSSATLSKEESKYQSEEDRRLEIMNGIIGQVRVGGKVRFVELSEKLMSFYSKADMATMLAHLRFPNRDGKDVSAFSWWQIQAKRRQYTSVVFEPDNFKVPRNALNLFRGVKITPKAKEGGWSIFHDHLLRNVCNGDTRSFEFLLDWMASLLTHLGHKIGVAVVLYGEKGCGKSIVSDILADCIGQEYCPVVDSPDALTGKHNKHLGTALLIRVEEAIHPKDPRHESRLKHLITGGRF